MKKTKILCLMLVACMVLLVAGCGGRDDVPEDEVTYSTLTESIEGQDTTDSTDSKEQTDSTNSKEQTSSQGGTTQKSGKHLSWEEIKKQIPASARGKTIEVFTWNEITDVTGAKKVIEDFTKETGIKVKWTVFTNDDPFRTKFMARVAANDSPDIVRLWQPYLSDMQGLQPLNKMQFNFNDEAWDKRVMEIYGFNGNVYATNMRNTLLQQPRCMVYNASLIGKYDLEDPYTLWKKGKWTWEKFEQICEAYTEQVDDSCYAWTSYKWADIPDSYGSSMLKRQGDTFVANITDPNLIKGWQKMSEFEEKGYTNHIYFDRTNFENGKVLFFTESPIGTRKTHYYFQSIKSVGGVRIVPIPSTPSNKATVMSEIEAYGIPVGAKNGDLSPYFLRYYLDGDNYDESNFFSDKSILDVYKKLMSADSFYVNYDDCMITEDLGKKGITINSDLSYTKAAQIQAVINQNANLIKAAADSANSRIKKLK